MIEGLDQIVAVNVVSNLFPFVAKYGVGSTSHGALHQIRQETVQLGAAMIWACEATAAESCRVHVEVFSVFLNQHVSGDFRRAEKTVHTAVDRHAFLDAVVKLVSRIDLPTEFFFFQWQPVWRVAVDLVR